MPGSDHSAACAGWWNTDVAWNTARPVDTGSTAANSPRAMPSAMILATCPTSASTWAWHDLPRLGREGEVRGEELRVVGHAFPLRCDEEIQPSPQPYRSAPLLGRHGFQGWIIVPSHCRTTASRSAALLAKWR